MEPRRYLPYMRTSLVHIPRRDLVLAASDSLFLHVAVVESDDPTAQLVLISGGLGGPAMQLTFWPTGPYGWHDYGFTHPCPQPPLWSGAGTPDGNAPGSWDFHFASGTMLSWPRRMRWAVQLNYETASSEILAMGIVHVRHVGGGAYRLPDYPLLTDDSIPITTDDLQPLYG
jgi:hypothetical protein